MLGFSKSGIVAKWLLEGDPSVRYQVYRDLLDAPLDVSEKERRRMGKVGWVADLLALRQPDGRWAGGWYGPKWTSTFYTLLLMKRLEAPPLEPIVASCSLLMEKGKSEDGGLNLFPRLGHSEPCVTGMFLGMACHFGIDDARLDRMVDYFADIRLPDGGWNCESYNGSVHSSFHTTLSILEGLADYARYRNPNHPEVPRLQQAGMEFLLAHRLFRSHRTGAIVDQKMLRIPFPPRWKYDILKCLDYARLVGFDRDERFSDAITVLRKKEKNGRWPVQAGYSGRIHFKLEEGRQPSRINTLRALRVLRWWDVR